MPVVDIEGTVVHADLAVVNVEPLLVYLKGHARRSQLPSGGCRQESHEPVTKGTLRHIRGVQMETFFELLNPWYLVRIPFVDVASLISYSSVLMRVRLRSADVRGRCVCPDFIAMGLKHKCVRQ